MKITTKVLTMVTIAICVGVGVAYATTYLDVGTPETVDGSVRIFGNDTSRSGSVVMYTGGDFHDTPPNARYWVLGIREGEDDISLRVSNVVGFSERILDFDNITHDTKFHGDIIFNRGGSKISNNSDGDVIIDLSGS